MDLGTVIGIVLIMALLMGAMTMGVGVGAYLDAPSALIVIGGSIGALLISFKPSQMKQFTKIFMIAIKPPQEDVPELIKKLVDFATDARKEGILSLEAKVDVEENAFLKKGLSMAIDGSEPDTIRELLEIEMEQTNTRHKIHGSIFNQWAGLAGAMGMVGTLIGLVAMLLNMADPAAIGPSMAVALLTTMYGAIIGNVVGTPIYNILAIRNDEETLV
ncbi:MAG: MotA/TolQ/ExbB proton channel family protein, partial [Campylobacterota bacterium]|nr:MotA/TolQ/ExbB proton channel family protein [Campylobacterota bacterium]